MPEKKENKDLSYVTKEDFLRDVARLRLQDLRDKTQAHKDDGEKHSAR